MGDKTNFAQSLMHMIKGNLGTGILAMPASFAHCGLVNALIGLPALCLIATYCVHLLVRSSQHLESKMKWMNLEYAELAKGAFKAGPRWMKPYSGLMCRCVDAVLIISQMGICCVYLVFIVDNIKSILETYNMELSQNLLFILLLPLVLAISYIRTLKRLAIASGCANALQVVGISIIVEFLIREMPAANQLSANVENFKPISEVALGFGSAMFAFEGISVVLPIYTRMKRPEQMGGCMGIVNLSYLILLVLYFMIGFLGYLKFGEHARGSITLNLPNEPLYDVVRAIFTASLFLTYPLQFYVPNEIIWDWAREKFLADSSSPASPHLKSGSTSAVQVQLTGAHSSATSLGNITGPSKQHPSKLMKQHQQHQLIQQQQQQQQLKQQRRQFATYEYVCRTILVLLTFVLAVSVPRLNLMMDLVGSISGTALSITFPAIIHIATFWEDTSGVSKAFMLIVDSFLIVIGLLASGSGSYFSFMEILRSFDPNHASLDHQIVPSALLNATISTTLSPLMMSMGNDSLLTAHLNASAQPM